MERSPLTVTRTWRPLGVMLASAFFGTMLVVVTVVAIVTMDPEIRAKWTPFQAGTYLFLYLLVALCFIALGRSKVTASESGLVVVNGFRRREFIWQDLYGIQMRQGAPWAVLDLGDDEFGEDRQCAIMALQATDGERARTAAREIKARIEEWSGH